MAKRRRTFQQDDGSSPPLRWAFGITGAFLLLIVFFVGTSSSKKQRTLLFDSPKDIPDRVVNSLDAIFVLGGGAPSSIDQPPQYTQRRCDDAAQVVKRKPNLPVVCLSAGTAHLPQLLSSAGLPIWESTSSAAYLLGKYPFIRNIYVETTSYDTIGNAYYARTSHSDIAGWKTILIVTNEVCMSEIRVVVCKSLMIVKFHMNRSVAIFDWVFGLSTSSYQLHYLQSPNDGLEEEALLARKTKETESLQSVHRLAKQYTSLKQLWGFMNHDHALYTAQKLVERGENAPDGPDDLVKKSYGGL